MAEVVLGLTIYLLLRWVNTDRWVCTSFILVLEIPCRFPIRSW